MSNVSTSLSNKPNPSLTSLYSFLAAYEPDEWEIERTSTKMLQSLGQGSFGMVYEGIIYNVIPGRPEQRCAIKTVNDNATSHDKNSFLQEAAIMKYVLCCVLFVYLTITLTRVPLSLPPQVF